MKQHEDFWQGKKVLLTGHTGFKGTWMNLLLESLGAVVCGYSLPLNPYSFYHRVSPGIVRHEEGDIADEKRIGGRYRIFSSRCLIPLCISFILRWKHENSGFYFAHKSYGSC